MLRNFFKIFSNSKIELINPAILSLIPLSIKIHYHSATAIIFLNTFYYKNVNISHSFSSSNNTSSFVLKIIFVCDNIGIQQGGAFFMENDFISNVKKKNSNRRRNVYKQDSTRAYGKRRIKKKEIKFK